MIVTTLPRAVRVIEHTLIPLQDGTMLAARIWLPEDAEQNPVPAILEYLPYRKRDGTYERDAVKPTLRYDTLPGRWVAEPSWPSPGIKPLRLFLTDAGLREATAPLTARKVCSPQTLGKCAGEWVPLTMSRDTWQIRVETQMRLSSAPNAFLLRGELRAWEGANEVCHREWDRSIPRDFL